MLLPITLKQDFNAYLNQNYQNKLILGEVVLVKALVHVLGKKYFAYPHMVHQNYVYHDLQHIHLPPDTRKCEIADILMLFTDGKELRYTFMQNKRDKKTPYGPNYQLKKLSADVVQWDLLHYRCLLSRPTTNGIPVDCLSSAILDSAATYGVFVNETVTNTVDMSVSLARDLNSSRLTTIGQRGGKRTYNIFSQYNMVQHHISGYAEIQGTTNLDDFEWAAQNMLIGSPLNLKCAQHRRLAEILLGFASNCLQTNIQSENAEKYISLINSIVDRGDLNIHDFQNVRLPFNLVIMEANTNNAEPKCFCEWCPIYKMSLSKF